MHVNDSSSAKFPGSSRDLFSASINVEGLDVSSTGRAEGLAKLDLFRCNMVSNSFDSLSRPSCFHSSHYPFFAVYVLQKILPPKQILSKLFAIIQEIMRLNIKSDPV